jgi:pimeloyl-ACP methyl ester carboxylesterase
MMVKNMLKSQGEGSAHSKAEAQYNATVSFDGTGYAKRIVCPTLVLTGTEDEIIPKENADGLCSLILHAKKVELEAMGHLLLIEDPENFVASVRSFIEGQVVG